MSAATSLTNMRIIGLTGRAGAGKDTVATMLSVACCARSLSTMQMAFADPIRWMLASIGVPEQYMSDRELKEQPVPGFNASYRHMAQTLGDWGRENNGAQFFVQRMAARLGRMTEGSVAQRLPDVLIVTDVRFANEAAMLTALGGRIVRVERHAALAVRDHGSERQHVSSHHLLQNNGSLDELRTAVDTLTTALLADTRLHASQGAAA
jgi:hypothetical protein